MVKEPETTGQDAGQEECSISKKERLIASNASVKRR